MKIDLIELKSIFVPFLINCLVPVKSQKLQQNDTRNASCNAGNLTIIEPNLSVNPVEYGDLRNYIPGLVSQIASLAIQSVRNDNSQITHPQKEIESHVEAPNRIKKTIDAPPLRNNLIIIGKSDDSRVKFMTNCDNTESTNKIIPSTECTPSIPSSEKQNNLEEGVVNTRNVKVQLDIPTDIKVYFNMEVQNGTDKLKNNSEVEKKSSDFPFKFSKPCVNDEGQNCCNLTLNDDKINHCQKCMCSHTPNKKCDCCSLNYNNPSDVVGQDKILYNSFEEENLIKKTDLPRFNDPKLIMNSLENIIKQEGAPKNVDEDLKHVEKRSDLPSNRNNIIIIGKDDVHVNAMSALSSTVCDGLFSSKRGLMNESCSEQSNMVKVRLDVPMDSKLFFNITVTNGTSKYEKYEASFSDPKSVYPKLSLAALKSVLETYKTKRNHTENTTRDPISPATYMFMKKDNSTTIYSEYSSTHKILDKNLGEPSTVKAQIDSVTTMSLKKKSRKKSRKVNKCSKKSVTNGTDEPLENKSKNIDKNSSSLMKVGTNVDITHPNL